MESSKEKRLAVFDTGKGEYLKAAIESGQRVCLFITDMACDALTIAGKARIPANVIDSGIKYPRFTKVAIKQLQERGITHILLKGKEVPFDPEELSLPGYEEDAIKRSELVAE